MVPNTMSHLPHRSSQPLALLFTDAKGRIVFVDNKFMELMSYPESGQLVGEPLNAVMGIAQADVNQLMQEVARTGYIHEHRLVMRGPSGQTVEVLCSCVATYNDQGQFIGADMTLYQMREITAPQEESPVHGDVLQARIQQIQVETGTRRAQEEQIHLQLYFTAQINALQVLLARMGGPRIHAALEACVNNLATRKQWPARLQGGHITVDEAGLPVEAYAELLKEIVHYGSDIVGRRPVIQEMREVDSQIGDLSKQAAEDAGLRQFVR